MTIFSDGIIKEVTKIKWDHVNWPWPNKIRTLLRRNYYSDSHKKESHKKSAISKIRKEAGTRRGKKTSDILVFNFPPPEWQAPSGILASLSVIVLISLANQYWNPQVIAETPQPLHMRSCGPHSPDPSEPQGKGCRSRFSDLTISLFFPKAAAITNRVPYNHENSFFHHYGQEVRKQKTSKTEPPLLL